LHPLFADRKNIIAYIEDNGFHNYTGFQMCEDYCFVYFPDMDSAQAFVDKLDGARVAGRSLSVYIAQDRGHERRHDDPSPRPRSSRAIRSRTIAVKNYPADYLGDRNLWHDFRETGFIRQIEVRRGIGYVQFDTEADAVNAVAEMNGRRLSGSRITVELIPDRILGLPNVVVPLIYPEAQREQARDGEQVAPD
jgi:RNA recognition motif-containing protein